MYPAVRELKAEFGKRVTFIVADIRDRETMELAARFDVRTIPHFVVVAPNGDAEHQIGPASKGALRTFLVEGIGQ